MKGKDLIDLIKKIGAEEKEIMKMNDFGELETFFSPFEIEKNNKKFIVLWAMFLGNVNFKLYKISVP